MDPRLLAYYNRELQHVREMGAEFARAFPKIAGRLALDEFECADPYVERLLEGLAFLAARIQLKMDAHYPDFTQHLFEVVYPHYVAPTPSMAVVQFHPDMNEGALAEGVRVPRGTMLRGQIGKGEQTACRYQTTDETLLWPLEIRRLDYFSRDEALRDVPDVPGTRAGLRLVLGATGGLTFDKITLEQLRLFLRGPGDLTVALYEQLLANTVAVIVRPKGSPAPWQLAIDPREIRRVGFRDDQAILPYGPRSFQGYRLLHEYFALPERFLSVELGGLAPALRQCPGRELEIFVLFDRASRVLEHRVDASLLALHCCPVVNLFHPARGPNPPGPASSRISHCSGSYEAVGLRTVPDQ
jgi:type VI secretion system protein ImpG